MNKKTDCHVFVQHMVEECMSITQSNDPLQSCSHTKKSWWNQQSSI